MSVIQALEESGLPKKLRMVVMCNKPSFEFRAFQVANKLCFMLCTNLIISAVTILVHDDFERHTTYFSYNILLIKQCDFTLARCNNNAMYILQMPYSANHSRVEQVYEQDADDALSQHNCCNSMHIQYAAYAVTVILID